MREMTTKKKKEIPCFFAIEAILNSSWLKGALSR
jgi:hypothetical protein